MRPLKLKLLLTELELLLKEREKILEIKNVSDFMEFGKTYDKQLIEIFEALNKFSNELLQSILPELNRLLKVLESDNLDSKIHELVRWESSNDPEVDDRRRSMHKFHMVLSYGTYKDIRDKIKRIEYRLLKKENACNCLLKQELGLRFLEKPNSTLIFLQVSDAYHDCELYQCEECATYWIWDKYCDDGGTEGWRKPREKHEFRQIKALLK